MRNLLHVASAVILSGGMAFGQVEGLPIGLTTEEAKTWESYTPSPTRGITTPPEGPIRNMAEWEELSAITITWTQYTSVLREIVRYAKEEVEVIINCSDSMNVIDYLANYDIDTENLRFIETNYNSIWIRDYGPNNVYYNDVDSLVLVDWIYNRPRPADDAISQKVADLLGVTMFETTASPNDLTHTGGNFMADGFGTGFSSELIIEENQSKSESEIDAIMNDYMGIDRYIKMPVLPYDGIHHIDMHMKLIDEETLLVGEYPEGVADGPQIEANLSYVLDNFNSVYGTPYKVVRIPMPDDNGQYPNSWGDYLTYANAIIINNIVLLPIYGIDLDDDGIAIWEEAMPGYDIIGIDCSDIIQAGGAIHCITHEIGVSDPLLIRHQALEDTEDTQNPYTVNALVKHRSGIQSATLYYKTEVNGAYTAVTMTETDPSESTWSADIPAQQEGTDVYYYVHAVANSGKEQNRPMPAPEGYWTFHVGAQSSVGIELNTVQMSDIYPNPASAITVIPVDFVNGGQVTIKLFDMLGNEVAVLFQGNVSLGHQNFYFNAGDYASGAYFINIQTEEGNTSQSIMIK